MLDEAVAVIGRNVMGVQGDIASLADLDRLYGAVRTARGHLDVLFVSGGTRQMGEPVATMTPNPFI